MKLSIMVEDKLPHELKHLYTNYWDIRNDVVDKCREIEPYICIGISRKMKDYLEGKGHKVDFVEDDNDYHFHLEVDNRYVVDGSDYQFDYDKPIGQHLPSRITKMLEKNNITTIGSVIALIDFAVGHALEWTDAGCGWDPNMNAEDHQQVLRELRPADIEAIKGRLLPIMLKILPISKWDRGYGPAKATPYHSIHQAPRG